MQKNGILNRDIAGILAKLGHTDEIVIADCGLPIPDDVLCIDVSLRLGYPDFAEIFKLLMKEMQVEGLVAAEESSTSNSKVTQIIEHQQLFLTYIPHELFKERTRKAKVIIRTGENTPYANVILQAGVIF
ncbi:D-ribose pyranase [Alkalicoccus halolimnae]|uniref:D-ribose pyranase n=1 Tax=Alkalicoccus halolimnae TaxID=1667239 RepID=A0A5C7FE05_9BACI|nr:D-ribose pyranase [Alkalicoccus halolimnae]TXF85537.1 D-ribose pyranase [Alkalicoccus halolimnae]